MVLGSHPFGRNHNVRDHVMIGRDGDTFAPVFEKKFSYLARTSPLTLEIVRVRAQGRVLGFTWILQSLSLLLPVLYLHGT